MEVLVIVDMQNDFVTGVLGTQEARDVVEHVVRRAEKALEHGDRLIFTRDTHRKNYLSTQEGRNLPVVHCVAGTEGWEIVSELEPFAEEAEVLDKPTFGSEELGCLLQELNDEEEIGKITLVGVCTDICVISNALLIKAFLPEAEITVDAACCAGVTPESHRTALAAMKACQIGIENE